mmetsp:Transcript_22386/g.43887  ORF Transcript_22386/g.43887 Transcript_22386/m.43887 type:complete len:174 (+) Transcript_22386:126-647(+)
MLAPLDVDRFGTVPGDDHNVVQGYLLKRGLKFQTMPCFGTIYKRRFAVIRGKFLYRFASENHKRPKGVPLDLEDFTVELADYEVDDDGEVLPFAFRLISVRKTYLFSAGSAGEREQWIGGISAARQRAIKQRLGHENVEPWEQRNNSLGQALQRQHNHIDELQRQENQMQVMY